MSGSITPPRDPPRLSGPGKLLTRAVFDDKSGHLLVLHSRQYRKGLPPHLAPHGADHRIPISTRAAWARVRFGGLNGWIALLFMVGSLCFGVAGMQAAFPDGGFVFLRAVPVQNLVFFIGSAFFTSAAFLQWQQSIQADLRTAHLARGRWRWWDWRPHDAGYMASFTQFIGTILFNLNTGDPFLFSGGWLTQDIAVWTPNMIGSILFLVSSIYACIEVGQKFWSFEPRSFSWWIAQSNLIGSVFFQLSAILSISLPAAASTGSQGLAFYASLCTALGALGFFLAAFLMLPEQADQPQHPEAGSRLG